MKAYKINQVIQGFLLGTLLLLLIATVFEFGFLMYVFLLYPVIGVLQYLSGWLLRIFYPKDKALKTYLIAATLTIVLIFVVGRLRTIIPFGAEIKGFALMMFPWTIAVYYWYITFKGKIQSLFHKPIFQ